MPGEIYISNDEARRRGLIHKPAPVQHGTSDYPHLAPGEYERALDRTDLLKLTGEMNLSKGQRGLLDGLRKSRSK